MVCPMLFTPRDHVDLCIFNVFFGQFGSQLGIAGDDPRRVDAGVFFELRYNLSAGHSFLPKALTFSRGRS